MKRNKPPLFSRIFKCTKCGNEQTVEAACTWYEGDTVKGIFGSDADFCEVCDGPVVMLEDSNESV